VCDALELANNEIVKDDEMMEFLIHHAYGPGLVPLLSLREMVNIYRLVKAVGNVEGEIAEVGVYQGGSAKIILEAEPDKPVHLFDTFGGLPVTDPDRDVLSAGEMSDTSIAAVKERLEDLGNVHFWPGIFPASSGPLQSHRFSFVHIDVDLYASTLAALEFFYNRVNPGGIILSHDYSSCDTPGVKIAFDEFFLTRREPVIEIWDSQCMVVKLDL
jgi:O-methyltransferase